MPSLSEWIMMVSTLMFYQAFPIRTVFLYWLAVGAIIGAKWLFKF
jgi:hypothetical protein